MQASLGAMLRHSCTKYGDRTALLIPEGKTFRSVTYAEMWQLVRRWVSGVRSLGLDRGDRLCILSESCVEWALLDWACQTLGIVTVPIYPTLPADQAAYIVGNSNAKVVVCGDTSQVAKIEGIAGTRVLLLRGEDSVEKCGFEAAPIEDESWAALIEAVHSEDIATIIYTSGTTGLPKGVLLSHRACLWVGGAVAGRLGIDEKDRFLSFLPLSHVYERADGHFLPISLGASIAYSKNLASLAHDIVEARPTIILCVPRFLEATMDRIQDGVRKQKPLQQQLFHATLQAGIARQRGRFRPFFPLLDRLVGAKIRARFGERIRLLVSGGAALPLQVAEFYGAFGLRIIQGYGLTETCGGIAVNNPLKANRPDTVGEILEGMECRIAPDGEILLRGPAIMTGYHNLPEDTLESIDPEGWYHTGDIGEFSGEFLRITDRKKDLLVLGNGKNVAPQPIENKLKESPLIAEAVVLGDGMDACVALIVPAFSVFRERHGGNMTDALIAALPEVKAAIKGEVDRSNKTLAGYEMVKRHAILDAPFTIETGELTPTLKVRRKAVTERYAEVIRSLA